MYDKLNEIMNEVREMHKLQTKVMNATCQGLSPEQVKLLFTIRKEQMNQKDLAVHFHITEATLSVRIKRLVELKFVEREVDGKDKRNYTIVLSKKGENMCKVIDDQVSRFKEVFAKNISLEEYETVLNFIKKIQKNIKEEIEKC